MLKINKNLNRLGYAKCVKFNTIFQKMYAMHKQIIFIVKTLEAEFDFFRSCL